MGRYSRVKDGYVEASLYLICDSVGNVGITRGPPDLGRDQRAVALTLKLPTALWKVPSLQATLTIEAPPVPAPLIDVRAASEALSGVLGVDIDLVVRDHDERGPL